MTMLLPFCSAVLVVALIRLTYVVPLLAVRELFERRRVPGASLPLPSACVVYPVYNESAHIVENIRSMLCHAPAGMRVVVIDDGSTDGSTELLSAAFPDEPRLQVVRRPHAGYAAALQCGLEHCQADVMAIADADTIYPPDYMERGLAAFRDPSLSAARALLSAHDPSTFIARMQDADYENVSGEMRAFSALDALLVVSGPAGFWRTTVLRAAGGFSPGVLSADLDATLAVLRRGGHMRLLDSIRVLTDTPTRLPELVRQRRRWAYGGWQVLARHLRHGMRDPRTAAVLLHVTMYRLLLPVVLPLADGAALWALLTRSPAARGYLTLYVVWIGTEWLAVCLERACQRTLLRPGTVAIPVLRLAMRMVQFPAALAALAHWVVRRPIVW